MEMLTPKQIDTVTEIINIGVGRGSASLSQMIGGEIILSVPYVNIVSFEEVLNEMNKLEVESICAVELKFSGEYEGSANVILANDSATQLASILLKEDKNSEALKEMKDGIIIEVGNIILNGIMGSFGNILNAPIDYHMPESFYGNILDLHQQLDQERFSQVLICRANFKASGTDISGQILIMYEMKSFDKLKNILEFMA